MDFSAPIDISHTDLNFVDTIAKADWWTMVEMDLGLLCPCLVTFRPLISSGYVDLDEDFPARAEDASIGSWDSLQQIFPCLRDRKIRLLDGDDDEEANAPFNPVT